MRRLNALIALGLGMSASVCIWSGLAVAYITDGVGLAIGSVVAGLALVAFAAWYVRLVITNRELRGLWNCIPLLLSGGVAGTWLTSAAGLYLGESVPASELVIPMVMAAGLLSAPVALLAKMFVTNDEFVERRRRNGQVLPNGS